MTQTADTAPRRPANAENPHAGQGPVMLDIGGAIGALVVTMPAHMEGVEIEIRPRQEVDSSAGTRSDGVTHQHEHEAHHHVDHIHSHGDIPHLVHVAVVGRPADGRVVHSAVFADLVQGEYELSPRPFGSVHLTVAVTGGEVASAQWPA